MKMKELTSQERATSNTHHSKSESLQAHLRAAEIIRRSRERRLAELNKSRAAFRHTTDGQVLSMDSRQQVNDFSAQMKGGI